MAGEEEGGEAREQTLTIGAVFWTLRRLQRELRENSDDKPQGTPQLEEEETAVAAVNTLLTQFCDDDVPAAQRSAVESELLALRERFQSVPVASRFLAALRQKAERQ